jgi:hypothetical protein
MRFEPEVFAIGPAPYYESEIRNTIGRGRKRGKVFLEKSAGVFERMGRIGQISRIGRIRRFGPWENAFDNNPRAS